MDLIHCIKYGGTTGSQIWLWIQLLMNEGNNIGDGMLNVLEDVIGPTHELPTEDEHADNFETDPL